MEVNEDSSIIVDHDLLRESYIPDKLQGRETQHSELMYCLSPIIKKRKPIHAWLYGAPGTGKTATAIHTLGPLEEQNVLKAIVVNCWEKHTFYEILDEMVSGLKILGAVEHRTSFRLEKLRSYLKDKPLVMVLDEIDRIRPNERSSILYNLDGIFNAGLVCISDSTHALNELEERVRSRLNPHTVFFPRYSCNDLLGILVDRAQVSLLDGSWSRAVLRKIASMAQGDARVAIRMLCRAALLADHHRIEKITAAGLRKQLEAARKAKKNNMLDHLTRDHRILYEIVKQNQRILSGDLWQKYSQRCERIKRKPLAPRTFSEYCNRLVDTGLICSERARVKGKVRLFKVVNSN